MQKSHWLWLSVTAALSVGCRKEEVQSYKAPKDPKPVETAKASAPEGETRPPQAPWTVPEGWEEKPASGGMRMATYGVTGSGGRSADVSVVALGREAGSALDNVNRWRKEVGLAAIQEDQIPTLSQVVKIGAHDGIMYELVGEKPATEGTPVLRTLAAVLPAGEMTVFFKIKGESALVAENKPKFLAWIKSVRVGEPDGGSTDRAESAGKAAPAPTAPAAPAAPSAGAPAAPSPGSPAWTIPPGWQSRPASSMRVATFAVSGDGGQTADMSVSKLGPSAGGTLANVNRWRGQIGLGALNPQELGSAITLVKLAAGEATVVDMLGSKTPSGESKPTRILAAIVERPEGTWFYKLTGDDSLVKREKDAFLAFVRSVKY